MNYTYYLPMIGLMDCNNFFVSCERLFRPDLIGKPVAVLSSNDGCIVARSQEVKNLGISMGSPLFQIKDLCEKYSITLFSSNFALYRDVSTRVMSALREEFDTCEVYSVDEAFFQLDQRFDAHELVNIRRRIMQKTGIPVSIGVAPTKTLAKVANGIAKKTGRQSISTSGLNEGVSVMEMDEWLEISKTTSCGSIWGIGRQTAEFLTKNNIHTVSELIQLDPTVVRQSLGVVGERLLMELNGIQACTGGKKADVEQESYTSTRSFHAPVHDKMTLMSALGHHTACVALKLRENECCASRITIIAQGSHFGDYAQRNGVLSTVLINPTNDTFVLTKEVSLLLDILYDHEIPYKKAGVIVSGIEPSWCVQNSLFGEESKTNSLSELEDIINTKFGHNTIRHGVTMRMERWQELKKNKSPNYTTQWGEIATVKAI